MKLASRLFLGGGVLYLLVAGIYWIMSYDEVGTIALGLTGGLSAMIGFYLLITSRRLPEQPEDDPEGETWQAMADYGHYSPHSWAPLMVGASVVITFGGLAFAAWITAAGAVLVVLSTAYWLFEYYRGPSSQF